MNKDVYIKVARLSDERICRGREIREFQLLDEEARGAKEDLAQECFSGLFIFLP